MTLLRSVSVRRSIRNCDELDSLIAPQKKWPSYHRSKPEWGNVTATKIFWGQISIVFAVVVAAMWLATQWTAWRLGFQSQLGPPWFEFAGGRVYTPVAFFWWWYHYDAYAPRIFLEGAGIVAFPARVRAYGKAVSRVAHAWATPRSGDVLPGNVAQPPFSM